MINLKKCSKIPAKALKVGTKKEMEHTNSLRIARKIASQHICENKNYYKILRKAGL